MRRLLLLLAIMWLPGLPSAAVDLYISPDVPTDDPETPGPIYLPQDVVRVDSTTGIHNLSLSLPGGTPVNALYRMCSGDWLISVEAPTELGAATYEPRDLIRFDGALTYDLFFCGGPVGIPDGVDVDAAFLPDGDGGDLVVSFDVPTDLTGLGGGRHDPADLVRFSPAGGCMWTVAGFYLNASATTPPIPIETNVTGADERGPLSILTFDVPTTLGSTTFLPGELVSWSGSAYASYHSHANWAISSRVDAVTFLADPGTVPAAPPSAKIHLAKPAGFPPLIRILWSPSSSAGVENYGIYEGTLGNWTSHTAKLCNDSGASLQEDVLPQAADSFYLVVASNANDEGSYGQDSTGVERPAGVIACRPTQALDCP